MGFRRLNFFSMFPAIFSKASRTAYSKAKEDKLGGDLKGDGMQNGGLLVVEKGGKTLLSFKQESPSDSVANAEILKALGIEGAATPGGPRGCCCCCCCCWWRREL
ncbi:prostamide/prostaglandin F synthase-like [Babylonia areolata]|uniref:prostamide/prostaglandin F synthase-like n=1 Tax=Babylonia areolata TaxID=304850 RepID=UPI003FD085F9